jgi:hypothetical protein
VAFSDSLTTRRKRQQVSAAPGLVSKLAVIIDWEGFRGELEDILGYANRDDRKGGRPPFDSVFMFKVRLSVRLAGHESANPEEIRISQSRLRY